jgi:hypothetical protein
LLSPTKIISSWRRGSQAAADHTTGIKRLSEQWRNKKLYLDGKFKMWDAKDSCSSEPIMKAHTLK